MGVGVAEVREEEGVQMEEAARAAAAQKETVMQVEEVLVLVAVGSGSTVRHASKPNCDEIGRRSERSAPAEVM
tara:strand:+ start:2219 stop:2437 length:219 start_codon:yes stop_codon:yes gene_type:complete